MRLNSIFSRYLLREMIPPFFINVMFFTLIFLLTQMLDITNMIVNYKVGLSVVALMMIYSMPYFLVLVIPMSVMMTILLTFLRLSGDNEIIALKAGGVSIYAVLPPVLLLCSAGCLLTGFMAAYASPWGSLSLKRLTVEVAGSHLNIALKERTFNDSFKDVMLYVNKINIRDKSLSDVFITDQRTKNLVITIISSRGQLFAEPDKAVFHLKLFNGTINQVDIEKQSVNSVDFDIYEMVLDLQKAADEAKSSGRKGRNEMYPLEMYRYLDNYSGRDNEYYSILLEFHRKFSIPFACFALGILAVPLGVQSKSSRRSFGVGLGIAFFLFYYLLLSAGMVFGEAGIYPPLIGMWVPNIVVGGIGIYFLKRVSYDRPVGIAFLLNRIWRMKRGS